MIIYECGSFVDWLMWRKSLGFLYIDCISPLRCCNRAGSGALLMSNRFLKRFVKKYIGFHQKFAKIEDFKVDHSKKLLNFQNPDFLYRKFNSNFDAFWWLSMILVVFLSGQLWSPQSLRIFDENQYIFYKSLQNLIWHK